MKKRAKAAAPQPAPEGQTSPPSKSDLIRAYAKEFPKAGPKEIAAALVAAGCQVTAAHVSTTLSTDRRNKAGKRRHTKPAANGFGQLIEAKKMVDRIGSIDAAREALNAYAVIVG